MVRWGRWLVIALAVLALNQAVFKIHKSYQNTKARQVEIKAMIYELDRRAYSRYLLTQQHLAEIYRIVAHRERYPLRPLPQSKLPTPLSAQGATPPQSNVSASSSVPAATP